MTRKLKMLGVAFVAVLALSAVAASAASAEGKVTCSSYPCTLTGVSAVGNDTFTTEAGNVECKSHFHSTLNEAVSSLTVIPTYSECKAFGFLNATVAMNGCDYLFTTPKKIGTHEWTSEVHVVCPTGKVIEINAGTCKVTIGAQTPQGHLIITNTTVPQDIDVRGTFTGINYTVTQDGFGCPFGGTGAKTGATYTQNSAVQVSSTNGANIHIG